jgi:MCP family monocarboxylic acid transporter-like MFS transporter 14
MKAKRNEAVPLKFGLDSKGMFMGAVYLPSLWAVSQYFNKKRGIATGITMAGSGVGAFAFAPFTQYLLKTFGWKVTNIILGAIVLQTCWCGALIKPLKAKKRTNKSM